MKISPLLFLTTLELLVIFAGLTIFLFIQYRKQKIQNILSQGESRRLQSEVGSQEKKNEELVVWKNMFDELQGKFEQVRNVNTQLKEAIEQLVPEAERSKEYEKLITDIEANNKELDGCIGTIKKENDVLSQKVNSFEREVGGLSDLLEQSVKKTEYNKVVAEKNRLELTVNQREAELKDLEGQYEKLEKNYIYLEKEFNSLYKNVKGEAPQ